MGIENIHIPLQEILEARKKDVEDYIVNELETQAAAEASMAKDNETQDKYYQMASSGYAIVTFNDSSVTMVGRYADIPKGFEENAATLEANTDVRIQALADQFFDDIVNSDEVKNKVAEYVKPFVIEEISNVLGGSAS